MKKTLTLMGFIMLLSGCTGIKGENYLESKPKFDLKSYFTGPIQAWGIVQDRSGNITAQFDIDMLGTWEGNQGKLVEDFRYYDGKTQQRIWHITALGDGKYEGRADDIIGTAKGNSFGNAGEWVYTMDLPVGDTTYRLDFNDWMWAMNDGVLMNRSYMKKFGFKVAEITIFMKKK